MSDGKARETIFALSSGNPPAAIAIVRISGAQAGIALDALAGSRPKPREATLRSLRDGSGGLIDRALILWFPGPATATGEDLVELHLHGGRAVVAATLAALTAMPGCRLAEPGEFTRRAFENGRIDLLQAEGLADLLAAETEGARLRALRLAEGGLSRLIGEWRDRLTMLSARTEAILEFGGDDPDIADDPSILRDIAVLADAMAASLEAPPAERLRDGIRVVIAGPPNAGKSSLLNALAGREVAIATPIPGTTRDLVEAPLTIGGIPMILIDSAGLRTTDDTIERLGIASAERALRAADIVLWLGAPEDCPAECEIICVHSRVDCPERSRVPANADIGVSTLSGEGIAALQHLLVDRATMLLPSPTNTLTVAQRALVEHSFHSLIVAARTAIDPVIRAHELGTARGFLDEMTGRRAVEPMLDALFGRFCVGK